MGQEAKATLRFDGRILEGTAHLEGTSIHFRGGASIEVAFTEISNVEAHDGWLDLTTSRGLLLFELGSKALAWAEKIKNPKGLVEKLGVASGMKVLIAGKLEPWLRDDIASVNATIAKSTRGKGFDLVFLRAASKPDLEKLETLRTQIVPAGAIWVVYEKGKEALTERDVMTSGRTRALTDNKQVRVDDLLTALRFVIPVHLRPKTPKRSSP